MLAGQSMSGTSPTLVAVVDDDQSVCRALARLLRAAGMQPTTYRSAEEFLADEERSQFDCLVFDVQLCGMSGIRLAQVLAAGEGQRAPIIYVTARDDPETRASAEAAGCAAYLHKGASGTKLLEIIRRLIAARSGGDLAREPLQ